ncbi:MAG: DUF2520 domain-containing protein [Rhodothermales bacterium]|nr:DUF2520 domain-containing protein [Rhodothermales bacterium]
MAVPHTRGFTLIGAGAVASTLAAAFLQQGWRMLGVFGRTAESHRAEALRLEHDLGAAPLDAACQASELVVIAVPDGQIGLVVGDLAATEVEWKSRTVFHTSGALSSEVLEPLRQAGAVTAAVHPLQSFPGPAQPAALVDAFVTVEGDAAAGRLARELFGAAGAQVVQVTREDKVAVHAAASVISNFTVTIAALAREILQTTRLGERELVGMLQPLLEGTVANIRERGPDRALTGPVVRGDIETVTRHVQLLTERAPHLLTVYVAIATETVRIARRTARLSSADAMEILDRVIEALPVPPAEGGD